MSVRYRSRKKKYNEKIYIHELFLTIDTIFMLEIYAFHDAGFFCPPLQPTSYHSLK